MTQLLSCKICNTHFAASHLNSVLSKQPTNSVNPRGMTMFDFVKTRYARWQRYSRTKSELEGLSNRELADLGIMRTDIHRLAREATR